MIKWRCVIWKFSSSWVKLSFSAVTISPIWVCNLCVNWKLTADSLSFRFHTDFYKFLKNDVFRFYQWSYNPFIMQAKYFSQVCRLAKSCMKRIYGNIPLVKLCNFSFLRSLHKMSSPSFSTQDFITLQLSLLFLWEFQTSGEMPGYYTVLFLPLLQI